MYLSGELLDQFDLMGIDLLGFGTKRAERPQDGTLAGQQRDADIEARMGCTRDERVLGEALVLRGVQHGRRPQGLDDVIDQPAVSRGLAELDSMARLEPKPLLVDEGDERNGYAHNPGGDACDRIERFLLARIENLIRPEDLQSTRLREGILVVLGVHGECLHRGDGGGVEPNTGYGVRQSLTRASWSATALMQPHSCGVQPGDPRGIALLRTPTR